MNAPMCTESNEIIFAFLLMQKKSERILTQHGLSGLPAAQQRIGTTTGMRQIKDARYWQSQLQIKMDEIRRETERLIKEKTNMDREKSAKKTFERRAKESTKELTGKHDLISLLITPLNSSFFPFSSNVKHCKQNCLT